MEVAAAGESWEMRMQTWAAVYARMALGAAFPSVITSRFGGWGKDVGYGSFAAFVRYTAEVNAFMPAASVPFLAWAAERVLGIALVAGGQVPDAVYDPCSHTSQSASWRT
ncbi:MAG: DoxX family protein [Gemmatimonadetes bacterium]|nr:DoxX family protein [Gemmatimonadota bacterium]